ncbi:MAG TPA: DUF2189 domain-containing protein [Steroidobacteraceae bacterium]|nr:DUF2189 domain-containing protein [Steroidobacteraceae bacterium]
MTEASTTPASQSPPVVHGVATPPDALPFVAPCRELAAFAPLEWLRLGWADFRAAPRQSLTYGLVVVLASAALTWVTMRFGGYWELLALVTGFILVAPLLAVGTYSISEQLERGLRPSLRRCFVEERRAFGNLMVFALMLMVVFLVWWRAASAIHIFFPVDMADPDWRDYLQFFGIGSVVGSIFAMIVFAAAAFSLPMLVDREADSVTAALTSANAVLRNKPAMAVWAALIVLAVAPGFALLLVGNAHSAPFAAIMVLLGFTLPLIGHATWHGYRATIDASAWPRNEHLER